MASKTNLNKTNSQERSDLVAYWSVPLLDGVHTVEFEHGTTSGKRVLRVDGKEIIRREWMFKLVGDEKFTIGKQKSKCELRVDPLPYFTFSYSLLVDGKSLAKFTEKQELSNRYWSILVDGKRYKIVFERHTLDVWVNAQHVETENIFIDDGTEMKFLVGTSKAVIKASYANKKEGVVHKLYIEENLIDEDVN